MSGRDFTNEQDFDSETISQPVRLTAPLALRDLIAGREFEVNEQDYCEEDFQVDNFEPDEIEDYLNLDALDLDVDESDKVICFADLRKKMDQVTSDGRIMKRIKKNSLDEKVSNNAVVYYHYSGYVNLEEEPFDNSYIRGKKPLRLVLGSGAVIPGLEIAIRSMRRGEVSQFILEPEYAFGPLGCPPRVPPEATILFEIELVDFVEASEPDEISKVDLSNEDEDSATKFERMYKSAKSNQTLGNDYFKAKNIKMAAVKYRRARDILLNVISKDEEDEKRKNHLLLKVLSNLAICYSKSNKPGPVCTTCRDAFYYNEEEAKKNPKLYYNWGLALMTFGDYSAARNKLMSASRLAPNDQDIKEALIKLEEKQKVYNQQSKLMYTRAFGFGTKEKSAQTIEKKSDFKDEMFFILKEKFEEAKKGTPVEIVLPDVVHDSILEVCQELSSQDIHYNLRGNKLIISKRTV